MKAPETFDEYLSLTEVKVMQRNGTVDRMAFPEYEEMMRRRINRYGSTSVEDPYETVAGRLMPVPPDEAHHLAGQLAHHREHLAREYAKLLQETGPKADADELPPFAKTTV